MYSFAVSKFLRDKNSDERRAFLEQMRSIQRQFGSRQADEFFINSIRCEALPEYNESYYSTVVCYNSALYLAHCGEYDEAARLMDSTGLLPGTGGDLLFSDHNRIALERHARQQIAVENGSVSILIAALPKSASASLSHTINKLLGGSVLRLSIGMFPNYMLVPNWVKSFSRGGAVTHDHFGASMHNLRVLAEVGIKRIFLQIRDPRSAVWSFLNMRERQRMEVSDVGTIYGDAIKLVSQYSSWISSWLAASQQAKDLEIDWIHYSEFNVDPFGVIERILLAHNHTRFMEEAIKRVRSGALEMQSLNVSSRIDDAWREAVSPALAVEFWHAISSDVREFLALEM